LRIPPVPDQIDGSFDKFVAKPVVLVFIDPNQAAPSGITINTKTPALFAPEIVWDTTAPFSHPAGRPLFPWFNYLVITAQKFAGFKNQLGN
jgi:hypothetical protein